MMKKINAVAMLSRRSPSGSQVILIQMTATKIKTKTLAVAIREMMTRMELVERKRRAAAWWMKFALLNLKRLRRTRSFRWRMTTAKGAPALLRVLRKVQAKVANEWIWNGTFPCRHSL